MNIRLSHLSAGYGKKEVLKDISVTFRHEEITGIIGPNGSGKSTLLKCIYRVLMPHRGDIFLDETSLRSLTIRESAKQVAVLMQQNDNSFDLSSEQIVLMGRTPYKGIAEGDNEEDFRIAAFAMEETGIQDKAKISYMDLSGGEKQRVMLARALAQETETLILDEPTNHLDVFYQLQIMDLISHHRMTVVAAIHDLNVAALYCDRIVAMQDGTIVAVGTPEEVLTKELIYDLYHVRADILKRNDGRIGILYERGRV